MAVISFTGVDQPYGWLGNMAPFRIDYKGQRWLTSEALFQSMRYGDLNIKELIRIEKSPMSAKMVAKSKKYNKLIVVKPCSPEDLENMRLCIRLKFEQNPVIKEKLKKTYPHEIVEDITKRNGARHEFWGARNNGGNWTGQNHMGKLLMELRDIFLEEEKI
jgi:predicted NAD-dependent protein-ADP-ribosyltransferase YbiA (DUF1768 family)